MIIIERAKPSDAKELLEYLKQAGEETDNLSFGAEGLPFTEKEEADYLERIKDSCDEVIFVAKDNGRIIADASISRLQRRMSHRGELGIAVLKEYWNRGVGTRLLSKIVNFAKENSFEVIDLQVRSDNPSAIHLYKKIGFEKIGSHPDFFKIDDKNISFDYMFLKL